MSVLSLVPTAWMGWKCWVCGNRHRGSLVFCPFDRVPRDMQH